MSGKVEAKIHKEEEEGGAHDVQWEDSFPPNRNDGRLKTQEDVSTNEKGKGPIVVERATSSILKEGVVKPKYLSRRSGSVLVGSKSGCRMEKRVVSIGSPVGGSLTVSYGPDQIL